jgi:hypothetical protein
MYRLNLAKIKKLSPILSFYVMILSVGCLGGVLLRFELKIEFFMFLVPLITASYVSFRSFWSFLDAKDKEDSLAKSS